MMFHAIAAHDAAQERHLALVINDQAEPVTHEGRDMQSGFCRTDNENVHRRLAAVDSQFECAEGHDCIVALFLRAFEALDERWRYQLNFSWRHPVEIGTGRHIDNPDLNVLS